MVYAFKGSGDEIGFGKLVFTVVMCDFSDGGGGDNDMVQIGWRGVDFVVGIIR